MRTDGQTENVQMYMAKLRGKRAQMEVKQITEVTEQVVVGVII
jgi:hypothetical protein